VAHERARVLSERRGDAVLVTLNAPQRRNAIDQQMVDALHRVLDEYWHDKTLAAVVITGAGTRRSRAAPTSRSCANAPRATRCARSTAASSTASRSSRLP
jgi:1,4-dihydroxy-2-naphthoyl-CoA synthase